MDVKSAFLYGTIEEEVYVCQPPSFEDPHFLDKVYKVEKALYGLHQAHKAWFDAQEILDELYRGTYFLLRIATSTPIETNKALVKDEEVEVVDVKQKDDGIFISQDKYVADILKKFDFVTMKTTRIPIETNKALLKDKEAEDVDVHLYRSMIGSLILTSSCREEDL
ncbi:putative ribonuclease H-like domain-containing protein, partial [Tanacetum coccineum]